MVQLDDHYVDPRLVEIYDIENPRGVDTDFYLGLADAIDAHKIVDLGCGTGLLTRELAQPGRQVLGVDPASAMLAFARRQPGAERVQWIEGDASAINITGADLAVMTGNVAQVFLDDADWLATLKTIHAALRPGGYLAFESRNPEARGWQKWNREDSFVQFDSPHGPMQSWVELVRVDEERVSFEGHNVFMATGEIVVVKSQLRFRSHAAVMDTLTEIDFTVEHVYGDWDKSPFVPDSRMMIFVARRK